MEKQTRYGVLRRDQEKQKLIHTIGFRKITYEAHILKESKYSLLRLIVQSKRDAG